MFRYFESLVDPYTSYQETDQPPQELWPFLRQYARPFHRIFALTALTSIVIAGFEIWLLWYLGALVDNLGDADAATFWRDHGFELALVAVFLLTLRPLVQAAQVALLNNTILPNFGAVVRWRSHRQVLRQSVGWFENDFAGRIANRVMQTPGAAGEAVFQVFDAITFAVAYLFGAAILLSSSDPRLLLPMMFWLVPYLFLLRWVILKIAPAAKAASDARSAVTGRVVDSYTNIHAVKMFAHNDRELAYAHDAIEQVRQTFMREMRLYSIMDIALILLNGVLVLGVVGWAIWLWSASAATVGIVATAAAMTLRLNGMSGWIMWAVSNFYQNLGIVSEGMETIAQPIQLIDRAGAPDLVVKEGRIDIHALSHHYGKEIGGIEHVDLTIPAGQKVGLVGTSGAGKSTLIKLILRFYNSENGRIDIDGQDIAGVTQDSLRRVIGMVQQDSALLHRSVRENILYGNPDADEEQMIAAARQAQAHEFILDLEDNEGRKGYDAKVGERGVKLSGGQRQRISLARVILKNAPILILDEATSALDSEVEAAIQTTLQGMMEGKTVIAIAHRLSTIAQMDRIIVMEQGRIIEDGTHDSLLEAEGQYARFWARQSGGFLGHQDVGEP